MISIPLQAVAAQSINITLNNQNVELLIYTKDQGMFIDVKSDGIRISTGVACLDCVPVVRNEYFGFIGNIIFVDTHANSDPTPDLLGTRYTLQYMDAEEYALLF